MVACDDEPWAPTTLWNVETRARFVVDRCKGERLRFAIIEPVYSKTQYY